MEIFGHVTMVRNIQGISLYGHPWSVETIQVNFRGILKKKEIFRRNSEKKRLFWRNTEMYNKNSLEKIREFSLCEFIQN